MKRIELFLLLLFTLSGCVSSRVLDRDADRFFVEQNYTSAANRLIERYEEHQGGDDDLLYLMDIGLALHSARNYEKSNEYLLKAFEIAKIKDYTSLADEAGSLLVGENIQDYKGEDFEKVLINTYLAINFLMLGNYEAAFVESRRVNSQLYRMIHEGKKKYQQSAFARYLSALMYEAQGEWGDAYIDYKKVHQLAPGFPLLGKDLWKTAWKSGRKDDLLLWKKEYHLTSEETAVIKKENGRKSNSGELILIYENGISPIKKPHPSFHSIPVFVKRRNPVSYATLEVLDDSNMNKIAEQQTKVLQDIEYQAIHHLDQKYAGIIAKKLAGVAAKEIVGNQVGRVTKNEGLGQLVKFAFYVADQADLRSWNWLPQSFQIARIMLPSGTYRVRVTPEGRVAKEVQTIEIKKGKKTFLNTRYSPRF